LEPRGEQAGVGVDRPEHHPDHERRQADPRLDHERREHGDRDDRQAREIDTFHDEPV
jgi:hypothetical protein